MTCWKESQREDSIISSMTDTIFLGASLHYYHNTDDKMLQTLKNK